LPRRWISNPSTPRDCPRRPHETLPLRRALIAVTVFFFFGALRAPAIAAPEGTLTWGLHVTLAARWLDPSDTEALINPFMVLYAVHDALVKPMPGGENTPSLAESWTVSKDGLAYEFVLRKSAKFHNGDPVTADDVKFSFERYATVVSCWCWISMEPMMMAACSGWRFGW
jgi:peptide/nickel transport system substrate-binding protein